jgi:hypothetical protein
MSEEVKRGRGRPRKNLAPEVVVKAPPKQFKMKAKPNWESNDTNQDDTPDRLRINPALIPEGMAAQWVTDSVYGQAVPQHRADFERKGWTPVHQEDFDGQFDGMFMPKGATGEIIVDGLVLMMRPKELSDKAARMDKRRAQEQVMIKEQSLRGGDIGVTLDSRDPSALATNRISKTMERIQVPE